MRLDKTRPALVLTREPPRAAMTKVTVAGLRPRAAPAGLIRRRADSGRSGQSALASGEYLFAKNVGVSAVLSMLSQHVHVDPPQRQRTSPISMNEVICAQVRDSLPRPVTRFQVGLPHRSDGVGPTDIERFVRSVLDPRLSTGLASDGLLEPDTLDKGRVLQQAQQRRLGRNEPLTDFCFIEPIETSRQHLTMFVDEPGQLLPVSGAETRGIVDVHAGTLPVPPVPQTAHVRMPQPGRSSARPRTMRHDSAPLERL